MTRTRIIHRGYSIEVWPVGFRYTVAIEPVRRELSILKRGIVADFASEDEAVAYAKRRIDALLRD